MADNLKVNAKSKILTFKKKHNLLVDGINGQTDQEFKIFENIVDKDGHARFIEGDITCETLPEGITQIFGRWSLSGSHLFIVIGLSAENASVLPNNTRIAYLSTLPLWIREKIKTFISNFVSYTTVPFWSDGLGSQFGNALLKQTTPNQFAIDWYTAITFTAKRACRIAFDLLIDNAETE